MRTLDHARPFALCAVDTGDLGTGFIAEPGHLCSSGSFADRDGTFSAGLGWRFYAAAWAGGSRPDAPHWCAAAMIVARTGGDLPR